MNDEKLKRKMCLAVAIMLAGVPEPETQLHIVKEEVAEKLNVIYCGPGEYTCGWQKSDLEHKFEAKWVGDNRLGVLVKQWILKSWDSFVTWFHTAGDVDIENLSTTIEEATELVKIWCIRWDNWEETKQRVRPNKWELLGTLPKALKQKAKMSYKSATLAPSLEASVNRDRESRSSDTSRSFSGSMYREPRRDRSRSQRREHGSFEDN
ncbi:MAG: hypothetical protein GY696_36320, partial [Gammaproteobacteria bacterium]|nr:hypothetical protein [Gammaproteobacteria bacterium]